MALPYGLEAGNVTVSLNKVVENKHRSTFAQGDVVGEIVEILLARGVPVDDPVHEMDVVGQAIDT